MQVKLNDTQKSFFAFVWPLKSVYKTLDYLTITIDPIAKLPCITLFYPTRPEKHGLLLIIAPHEMTDFLTNLKKYYRVINCQSWQIAVEKLFLHFLGIVPDKISRALELVPENNHWHNKLGDYLHHIRTLRQELSGKIWYHKSKFNVDQFIQHQLRQKIHPSAILTAIGRLNREWELIKDPWAWGSAICNAEQSKYSESERAALHLATKTYLPPAYLQSLLPMQ